ARWLPTTSKNYRSAYSLIKMMVSHSLCRWVPYRRLLTDLLPLSQCHRTLNGSIQNVQMSSLGFSRDVHGTFLSTYIARRAGLQWGSPTQVVLEPLWSPVQAHRLHVHAVRPSRNLK